MAHKRHALDNDLLDLARIARKKGETVQFAIDHPRGLSIHVHNGEMSYYCQARTGPRGAMSKVVKRRIVVVTGTTFDNIKKIAAEALNAIREGRDPDPVIRTRLAGGDKDAVELALDRADARANELWTLRRLINEYLAQTTKGRHPKPALRPSSRRELIDRLRDRPEAAVLMDRSVKELRLPDFENVRDDIKKNAGTATSSHAKFVDLAKRVLDWGHMHHRLRLGLEPTAGWWIYLAHQHKNEDRSHRKLTPDQVGMLIALVEQIRVLEPNTSDSVLGALQVSWMLVQRSTALANMKALGSARWVPDPHPDRQGWQVYTWLPDEVKSKRQVKFSVPPQAIKIIQRVAASTETTLLASSAWAFPQTRDKYLIRAIVAHGPRIVPPTKDKAISTSALNHALDALAGRLPDSIDLLKMVGLPSKIGMHDLRRSIADFFDGSGETAYASALLDHKVTGVDKMSRQVAAITQNVYSASDRVQFKSEGLVLWMDAVLPAYETAKSDPRLWAAVADRKKELSEIRSKGGKAKRKIGPRAVAHRET